MRTITIDQFWAMEQLLSFQDGPPLISYEKGWKLGVDMCRAVLKQIRETVKE